MGAPGSRTVFYFPNPLVGLHPKIKPRYGHGSERGCYLKHRTSTITYLRIWGVGGSNPSGRARQIIHRVCLFELALMRKLFGQEPNNRKWGPAGSSKPIF